MQCKKCGAELPYNAYGDIKCQFCNTQNYVPIPEKDVVEKETPRKRFPIIAFVVAMLLIAGLAAYYILGLNMGGSYKTNINLANQSVVGLHTELSISSTPTSTTTAPPTTTPGLDEFPPLTILNPQIIYEHTFGQNYQVYIIGDVRNDWEKEVSMVQVFGIINDKWGHVITEPRSPPILKLMPGESGIFNLSFGLYHDNPDGYVDHYLLEARTPDIPTSWGPILVTKPPSTTPRPTTTAPPTTTPVTGSNMPPIASFSVLKVGGSSFDVEYQFNASMSRDSDGKIISYKWDFGDTERDYGELIRHYYYKSGTYKVILTVQDDAGDIDTDTFNLVVKEEDIIEPIFS